MIFNLFMFFLHNFILATPFIVVRIFLLNWEFSHELGILLRVENFLRSWKFCQELRTFSLTWEFPFCVSENIFPWTIQNASASIVSKTLEKEEIYRAKILDSLCSLSLMLWAISLYSLEYKDSWLSIRIVH